MRVQEDRPRSSLAVAQSEHVTIDIGPAQAHEFALPASGQEQQANDLCLLLPRPPSPMIVECLMEATDFGPREKAGELPARIANDAAGWIRRDVAAHDGVVQDLSQHVQRSVRSTRRGLAIAVEPQMHSRPVNPVER